MELGLFGATLKDIQLRFNETEKSPQKNLMLRWWMQEEDDVCNRGGANWRTLVAALRTLTEEEKEIADSIQKQYLPQQDDDNDEDDEVSSSHDLMAI